MREPYRLAILDDEPLIAMGLKKLILHMGHSRIGQITTYTMPADALKGILKNPPDLLFTDIKMPEMTGLELAERLRNEGLDILVVILSGYDDFFLVQKALRLGCHDYLRKPASTEDIARVLDRSASLLDSNISQQPGLIGQLRQLHQGEVEHMLYRIYREGSISQESLSRIVEFSYTLFPGESFILMLTESNRKQDGMNFDDDLDLLIAERDKLSRFHTILESPGYRCLSLVSGGDSTELNNLLDSIDRKLFSGFTGEVTLSCSRSFKGLDSLSEHFGELKISRTGKLFGSPSPLLKPELSGGIRTVPPGHIPDENMILFSRLELSLARRDYAVCREELNRITKRWTEINDKRCKYMFLSGAFERLEKGFNDHFGKMEQPLKLEDFQSPAHLFDYLNERLDEGEKDDISRESRIIYRAKEFIHEHYAETVDMAALAEELNISYSYFSTLFRRTCSMTFLDYLGAYRMDIASRLLKETSLPVQSIAERVGYTHSRHFSRAFRKYTGRSPSEYRAY